MATQLQLVVERLRNATLRADVRDMLADLKVRCGTLSHGSWCA